MHRVEIFLRFLSNAKESVDKNFSTQSYAQVSPSEKNFQNDQKKSQKFSGINATRKISTRIDSKNQNRNADSESILRVKAAELHDSLRFDSRFDSIHAFLKKPANRKNNFL
jgi:hypothetical protein